MSSNNHYNESKIFTPVRDYSRNHITPTKQTPQGRMNENFIKQIEKGLIEKGISPNAQRKNNSLNRSKLSLRRPIFDNVIDYSKNYSKQTASLNLDPDFMKTNNFFHHSKRDNNNQFQ